MSVIVSNTTPINYLVLIDHIAVLRHLYARVIIPQAVFGELQADGTPAGGKSVDSFAPGLAGGANGHSAS